MKINTNACQGCEIAGRKVSGKVRDKDVKKYSSNVGVAVLVELVPSLSFSQSELQPEG
jgi:hypothetical protein